MTIPKKYLLLHGVVMCYLILAFSWWAILLYKKNDEAFKLRSQLSEYDATIDMSAINDQYDKQRKMILSEGAVLGLSILIGLMLIYRAFKKELKLNTKLNDFLLSVTHELKTPIATLKLVNKTLKRKDLPESKRQVLLNTGWEESLRLESQVNNLLTAAQIEDAYTFNFQSTDLNLFLKERLQSYKRRYPDNSIAYRETENIVFDIDKESFAKAIDNLVSNAIKYAPTQTALTLKLTSDAQDIVISILDNGIGIPDIEKNKVWEKFYRVGHADTRETKGTGLGLWIVRSIITAHGGHVSIEDNRPKGSIFSIILPAA